MNNLCRVAFAIIASFLINSSVISETITDRTEPIPPYGADGYDQLLFDKFIGTEPAMLWAIVKPSFGPEYAITLRTRAASTTADLLSPRAAKAGPGADDPLLHIMTTKSPIWHGSASEINSAGKLALRHDAEITDNAVQLSGDVANLVTQAWTHVLSETQYPRLVLHDPHVVVTGRKDGTIYEFYVSPNLSGQTWSPQQGAPKKMVDLTEALLSYGKATAKDRPKILFACRKLAQDLIAYQFQ